jgi:hypothetical protein
MKVKDLIEQLGYMDQEAEVHFQYNYGDHWRTQVAPSVDSVEMGVVKYSDYHRMPKVVEPDWDDEDADEVEGTAVVLIG